MKKYIWGLCTGIVIIPIIESFLELIYSWIEVLKTKPASIVNKWNKEIMKDDTLQDDVSVIGFQIPSESDDDYEDE